MPWRPGGRFPRFPFPGRGFPRFPRSSSHRPHVYWADSFRDIAAGTLINGNTLTATSLLTYSAGGLTEDPTELGEELSLRRLLCRFRYQVNINPSVTSYIASYFGVILLDIEPSTGNIGETTAAYNVSDRRVIQGRRWLYQNVIYWGNWSSGGTTTQNQWGISDFLPQDARPQVDIQLKGMRIRDDQRLFWVEYHEESGASDANLIRRNLWSRALITKRP